MEINLHHLFKFTPLFKFNESNVEGLGIDEEMKEKINKLNNSDKPWELFEELFKIYLIQLEGEEKNFKKRYYLTMNME